MAVDIKVWGDDGGTAPRYARLGRDKVRFVVVT